jgi:hypothetical protein
MYPEPGRVFVASGRVQAYDVWAMMSGPAGAIGDLFCFLRPVIFTLRGESDLAECTRVRLDQVGCA